MIQGAAAFFMYSFIFLEKEPIYQCRILKLDEKTKAIWNQAYPFIDCAKEDYCFGLKSVSDWVKIDWNND